jgi:prolyl-tRNA editing enzyme YbaK/EbsC (Cys-tRNA(Pro) deacylase)
MPVQKLKEFLDSQNIKYVAISHSKAYTAQGIAALTHISGKELAKTVIVKLDDALAMIVLPASDQVDLSLLKAATGAKTGCSRRRNRIQRSVPRLRNRGNAALWKSLRNAGFCRREPSQGQRNSF